jgi:hypothetical protein
MSPSDVLDVELEWFRLDLANDDVPPLVKPDGPFMVLERDVRRLAQARTQLYLTRGPTTQPRSSKTTTRLDHEVIALVLWAATGAGARAHQDQEPLDDAMAKVVARVLGPDGDVGHGGRWFKVGPVSTQPVGLEGLLRWGDAIGAAGAAYTVAVRWSVSEFV